MARDKGVDVRLAIAMMLLFVLVLAALAISIAGIVLSEDSRSSRHSEQRQLDRNGVQIGLVSEACAVVEAAVEEQLECLHCEGADAVVTAGLAVGGGLTAQTLTVGGGARRRRAAGDASVAGAVSIGGSLSVAGDMAIAGVTTVDTLMVEGTIIARNLTEPFDLVAAVLATFGLIPPGACRSEWNAADVYLATTVVVSNGTVWQSVVANQGQQPYVGSPYWAELCGTGAQGPPGYNITGAAGRMPLTNTTAMFTQPDANATAAVAVADSSAFTAGQNVYVSGAGYYLLVSTPTNASMTLLNVDAPGNAANGSAVPAGAAVSPAGSTQYACSLPYCPESTSAQYGGQRSANNTATPIVCNSSSPTNPCNNRTVMPLAIATQQSLNSPIAANSSWTCTVAGLYEAVFMVGFTLPAGSGPWEIELVITLNGADYLSARRTYFTGVTNAPMDLVAALFVGVGDVVVPYFNLNAPTASGTVLIGATVSNLFSVYPVWM